MLELKSLHKSYKMGSNYLHVLKGINFKVNEGELVAIMGSSGSGAMPWRAGLKPKASSESSESASLPAASSSAGSLGAFSST